MISPIKIALQGLQPGSTPIEIGTQGFIVSITPTPEEDGEDTFFVPLRWSSPRTRQDCVVKVQGCRASISATGDNIAAAIPSTEEQDIYDDIAFCEEYNRRLDEREAEEAEQRAHERFMERMRQANEIRAERKRQRQFRKETQALADEITPHGDTHHDLAAIIVFLKGEISELSARIGELESEKTTAKPAPKTRRKK